MAETKKVQLKDLLGNELLPQTSSDLVKTSDGTLTTSLGKMITQITINGETVNVVSGKAAITLPTASEYSIQKAETADEGFASTYTLTKDGVQVGSKINIPKDMVVQSFSYILFCLHLFSFVLIHPSPVIRSETNILTWFWPMQRTPTFMCWFPI